jgi:Fur family zinc uptake transcriptional regulator
MVKPSHKTTKGPCAHAHSHAERAPDALRQAEATCNEKGLRLTPIRRAVLESLFDSHCPAGAYDIIEALARKGAKRLAPITIYRALDFLLENGFAHRLASRNAYLACPFGHRPDTPVIFLICDACGGVDECTGKDLQASLSKLVDREGFHVENPVIELAGRCAHCRVPAGPGRLE